MRLFCNTPGVIGGRHNMDFFEGAYKGTPPWDIGRPQGELVALAQAGEIKGSVLDVGCGTGENALYLAALGHEVWGVDFAPTAIAKAKRKASRRRLKARFLVADALNLQQLGRTFDTVLDSGLFHSLSDEERPLFLRSLASVLPPGGKYLMLCFSELETGPGGPRRITRAEIKSTFAKGWRIDYIKPAQFESKLHEAGAHAWLASVTRG